MKKEEKVSFYSHMLGFVFAIAGTLFLSYSVEGFTLEIISIIYGVSVIVLFICSSLYHANKEYEGEETVWRKLDHVAIFIMIAGTYTPVIFVYLTGSWKWSIIIIQWLLVIGGLFFKFFYLNVPRYLYTIIYLLMGWMGIVPIVRLVQAMSSSALIYLFAGGISYTIGAIFYIMKKPQFNNYFGFHEIFHIFILLGAFFHYLLVYTAVV